MCVGAKAKTQLSKTGKTRNGANREPANAQRHRHRQRGITTQRRKHINISTQKTSGGSARVPLVSDTHSHLSIRAVGRVRSQRATGERSSTGQQRHQTPASGCAGAVTLSTEGARDGANDDLEGNDAANNGHDLALLLRQAAKPALCTVKQLA